MVEALYWAGQKWHKARSLTNGLRLQLAAQETLMMGVHVALVDTDMTRSLEGVQKTTPHEVVQRTLDGVVNDQPEVLNQPTNQAEPEHRHLSAADYAGLRLWRPAHNSWPRHGNWRVP